jgi:L-arabinose isomerase
MSVKRGPVTLLSVVQTADKLMLLTGEADSVPGPILEIGKTNSRYRFPIGARRFMEAWNAEGPAITARSELDTLQPHLRNWRHCSEWIAYKSVEICSTRRRLL